jgi:hypothetical protein
MGRIKELGLVFQGRLAWRIVLAFLACALLPTAAVFFSFSKVTE